MDDKDRTLKALEDMKESMAYAVRRKQQIHDAVPIVNGGASTKGSGAHPPTPTIGELFDAYWKGNKRLNIYDHSPHEIADGLRNVYFFGVSTVAIQRDALAEALRAACPDDVELGCDECAPGPCAGCWVKKARALLRKVDGTARETSTVAQDK